LNKVAPSPSPIPISDEHASPESRIASSELTSQLTKFAFNSPIIDEKGVRQINGIFASSPIAEETWAVPVFVQGAKTEENGQELFNKVSD